MLQPAVSGKHFFEFMLQRLLLLKRNKNGQKNVMIEIEKGKMKMKRLLVFLKNYKKESALAPIFKMLEAFFELLVPLVMAAIIDKGIANEDKVYIGKMGFIMVGLGLIGMAVSVTAQYFSAKAAVGFSTELKHALFAHIQQLSFTELDKVGTSTLMTRMTSDVNQVQNGVNMTLRLFMRSPFIVFGAMVMAFTIDVKCALIFVVTIPMLSIVVFGIMIWTIPLYRKVQGQLDNVLNITRENLAGVRVIRAFNKENEETARFDKNNSYLAAMQMFVGKISAVMNPVTYVMINAAIMVLIWSGAIQVNIGKITQGEVVALVNYMSQILVELVKLASLIITITKALACAKRIEAVFDISSSMPYTENGAAVEEQEEIIRLKQVGLTYEGAGEEALSDIDFSVKKGQTIGIIGGTGSGKSSLVHLILRFYDATRGEVLYHGKNVKEYSLQELRSRIRIVMQKAVLFGGTIAQNLAWGKEDATSEEMWQALESAQAAEFVRQKEGQLESYIEQGGRNLSGGQRQRLTIARALIGKPDILILDDSASALDYATDAKLRKAIAAMEEDTTVFIVSQRTSSLQHADQIIVLEDGKIAGIGTHEELVKRCVVYREIYESQYAKQDA